MGSSSNGCLELYYWVRAGVEGLSITTQLSGRGRKPTVDSYSNTDNMNVILTWVT